MARFNLLRVFPVLVSPDAALINASVSLLAEAQSKAEKKLVDNYGNYILE